MTICVSCGHENPAGARFCNGCGSQLAAAPAREQRKTVTVVFCDVTGSTALGESIDPEALRALMARYFERMQGIVERHGGSVEKFIGDAVMAVFGVPVAHEDDALRACRAAAQMRDALPELGIAGRIGVNTGEVVVGAQEVLATGDAVNVAARFEQAAQPGEVLVGAATLRLVRGAVEVGSERLLELKGKREPVRAFPLLAVSVQPERRFSTPMVGREHELARLRAVFGQARHDRSCQLFTILGSAGVGKSRLAAELLTGLDAVVLRGRCLSYGEGITYWPVVEMLHQLGPLPEDDTARPLRSLLGESDDPVSADEIAWGFRKLLERHAEGQPLVVVFDDIQWAEETLLDLVEHIADLSRDAPILLLCIARPELLERRPSWGGGKWNATTVLLEALDAAAAEQLLAELGGVGAALHERIVQLAEGNPLFLEETLALVRDSDGGEVEVPPTIQGLLAARLDQLDPSERSVLERGAVEGRTFHRGTVAALADADAEVDGRLVALVRKQLVRPDRAQLPGEDAYRFRHLLIRDAAYDALPKRVRAELHERFAVWLQQHGAGLVELDEILGYHLERAARYREELGLPDAALADRAGERLAMAGRNAAVRGDDRAAARLLRRALELIRPLRLDVRLELDLVAAIWTQPREAATLAAAVAERARNEADATGEAHALAVAAFYQSQFEKLSPDRLEARIRAALPLLEQADDEAGQAELWHIFAFGVANARGRWGEAADADERALRSAQHGGRPAQTYGFAGNIVLGPVPAGQALARLDALAPRPTPQVAMFRSWLLAMLDRIDEAQSAAVEANERLLEQTGGGQGLWALAEIAVLAGDLDAAALHLSAFCDWLEEGENYAFLSTFAPHLGRVLCALGRYDEAEPLARRGRELGDEQDAVTQALWRLAQALVDASRGQHAEAERLAREALAITETTDSLWWQGEALCDLATVLRAAGRDHAAIATLQQALARYERKQILPLVRRTRERIEAR